MYCVTQGREATLQISAEIDSDTQAASPGFFQLLVMTRWRVAEPAWGALLPREGVHTVDRQRSLTSRCSTPRAKRKTSRRKRASKTAGEEREEAQEPLIPRAGVSVSVSTLAYFLLWSLVSKTGHWRSQEPQNADTHKQKNSPHTCSLQPGRQERGRPARWKTICQ